MTTAPTELTYGYVDGRLILIVGDTSDEGRMPDPTPATGTRVQITPQQPLIRVGGADPTTVVKKAITCTLDEDGRLLDPANNRGVWLVTGVYTVTYQSSATIPSHDIEVTAAHTESTPLDLTLAMPPGGPVLTPSEYAELSARIDGIAVEAGVTSINGATGTVTLDADDVGALPSSYTPPAQSWTQITGKPTTFAPTAHAASHATGGSDQITPESLGATTVGKSVFTAASTTAARTAIGAGTSSLTLGTTAGTAAAGNDTRLSDARTPTAHTHAAGDVTSGTFTPARLGTGTASASTVLYGDGAWKAAPTAPVSSVNGKTGAVTLGAADVGALPSSYTPPAQSWTQITGKPATFPPSAHTHAAGEITGLPGPQTLSISGSNLALSGGGGTVTLPAGGGGGAPIVHTTFSSNDKLRPLTADGMTQVAPTGDIVALLPCAAPFVRRARRIRINIVNASTASALVEFGIYNGETLDLVGSFGTVDLATAGLVTLDRGVGNQILIPPFALLATRLRSTSASDGKIRVGAEAGVAYRWVGNSWDGLSQPTAGRAEGVSLPGTGALPATLVGLPWTTFSGLVGPFANIIAD